MDKLSAMRAFVAAVDAGSLSAAARQVGLPLTTVSRRVSDLEAELGTRLLTRSSRRLTLTDAGNSYIDVCRRVLELLAEAEYVASGEYTTPKGQLTLTAPIVFGRLHVLPIVTEFLKAYPEIDIRLTLSDRTVSLIEDRIDAAIRIGSVSDSSLVALKVGAVRRVACASLEYLAARGVPKMPADLSGHDCVTFEGLQSADAWLFPGKRGERPIAIRSRLAVTTAEAAIDAAVAGLGITCLLSYQAAPALESGALVAVLRAFEPPPFPVHIVHSGGRRLPLKIRAFLDFAAPRLRERLARQID